MYGSPLMHWIGREQAFERTFPPHDALRHLPQVRAILRDIDRGGFPEAVIRMLIILAESARLGAARPARNAPRTC